jgi:hypothetical protein
MSPPVQIRSRGQEYAARGRVYLTVEESVSTDLFTFSDAVKQRLLAQFGAIGKEIHAEAGGLVGGHGKGQLARSIRDRVKAYGTGSHEAVVATVWMGGKKTSRHAHAFEKGFGGAEKVRAHYRHSKFGTGFNVTEYQRNIKLRAHPYLEIAVTKRRSRAIAAVLTAIRGAAEEKGLAA